MIRRTFLKACAAGWVPVSIWEFVERLVRSWGGWYEGMRFTAETRYFFECRMSKSSATAIGKRSFFTGLADEAMLQDEDAWQKPDWYDRSYRMGYWQLPGG